MLRQKIDERFYPDFKNNWDDKLFFNKVSEAVSSESIVLDLGAGAGIIEHMNFKGKVKKICGIDLDKRVLENPYLDEAHVADAENIPYPDGTFDIVCCDNVLEHLEHPIKVFKEVSRVLKPGGKFLFKTPNKFHYVPIIAKLTPHSFHEYINAKRGRAEVDTFKTHYKANSRGDIKNIANKSGFKVDSIEMIEGRPEYLRFNAFTYLCGMIWQRIISSSEIFSGLRVLIVGVLSTDKQR
jgi:SAM-dependent methyltransferase